MKGPYFPEWKSQTCGCVKTTLPIAGKIVIRCERHRGKPSKKRVVCHFELVDGTMVVRRG